MGGDRSLLNAEKLDYSHSFLDFELVHELAGVDLEPSLDACLQIL
jgi:hypothetical protein